MIELPLMKYIEMNTEYILPEKVSFVIEAIGTDDSSQVEVLVDNKPVAYINNIVAPLDPTDNNLLGPLSLGKYYIVVAEESRIKCVGTSGKYVSLRGKVLIHDPGEKLPEPYISRFRGQYNSYWKYWEDTYSHGTDTAWAKDGEQKVLEVKPGGAEEFILFGPIMVGGSGGTITHKNFSLVTKLDGKRVEYLWQDDIGPGIDIMALPRPPTQDNWNRYDYGKEGLRLTFGHKIEYFIRNISGADLSPSSGSEWSFTVTVPGVYIKV